MSDEELAYLKSFGAHLYNLRKQNNISRVQLAFEIETNEKHLRLIEKGEISTGLSNLYKISKALNISMQELFDFEV
ncbi:transcriptional regulator, XRE family [Pedobacter xixiisoli]|uniref:Transcriptional regulator, XRE family n=2 Tax=Pedobacter xixiisoli TaxID=1476464 RepID=A0A286A742_9SPHI|nr:transcriptional regulator, XRE family [Pedobacter xixiisoli]